MAKINLTFYTPIKTDDGINLVRTKSCDYDTTQDCSNVLAERLQEHIDKEYTIVYNHTTNILPRAILIFDGEDLIEQIFIKS